MQNQHLISSKENAAKILQLVLDGKLSSGQARNEWPDYEGDSVLDAAFHMLYHIEDDDDIRAKDTKYANWQFDELKKMISQLAG